MREPCREAGVMGGWPDEREAIEVERRGAGLGGTGDEGIWVTCWPGRAGGGGGASICPGSSVM